MELFKGNLSGLKYERMLKYKKNGNLFHTDDNRIFNSHAIEWANKPSQSDSMTVFIN